MNHFVYLFPIKEYINDALEKGSVECLDKVKDVELVKKINSSEDFFPFEEERRQLWSDALQEFSDLSYNRLNSAIHRRYRVNGFKVSFVVFSDTEVADFFDVFPNDFVVDVPLSYSQHSTACDEDEFFDPRVVVRSVGDEFFPYVRPDFLVNKLPPLDKLVVSGFHCDDCVDMVAFNAYKRGYDVLVDEELSDLFPCYVTNSRFDPRKHPSFDPFEEKNDKLRKSILDKRSEKPWLFQF